MSHSRARSVLSVLIVGLALAAPVQATPSDGERAEVRGQIADVHYDTFAGEVRHEIHLVVADGTSVVLDLPGHAHPAPGSTATARGVLRGRHLTVDAAGLALESALDDVGAVGMAEAHDHDLHGEGDAEGGATAETGSSVEAAGSGAGTPAGATATTTAGTVAAATVTKRIAVLLINFADDTSQTYTQAGVANAFFGAAPTASVATFYAEQSYGAWATVGDVLGYFTVTGDRAACNWSDWGLQARNQATAAGINLGSYTNIVHLWRGQGSCAWSGLAYLPGTLSFLNGTTSLHVATHELGHNYGAHHASTYSCTESGVRVAISSGGNCSANEYGDPFDTMGNGSRLSHPWHRKQEGQLTTADQLTITAAGRYTVGVANATSSLPHRIVRVPRGDGSYFYLDFRQPGGAIDTFAAGDPIVNGVTIRLNPDTAITQSRLIDTTPATTTFADATLLPGKSFFDPVSTVSITTIAIDASAGATVDVSWGPDSTLPSGVGTLSASIVAGPGVRLAWSAATDNRAIAGYVVARDGTTVTTVGTTTWTDSAVTGGVTYSYSVRAIDTSGNLGAASSVTIAVPIPDTLAPTAPTGLGATPTVGGKYQLKWGAATDNVGVTGYRVYDGSRLLATVSGGNLSYTYKPQRGAHTWTVRAIDAAGNVSSPSGAVALTI